MKRVYVAGKYNDSNVIDVLKNMRKGIELATEVLLAGHAPFCPWLDFQYGLHGEFTHLTYLDYSMEWLKVSECVLLVPGWQTSPGVKAELDVAYQLGLPIFHSLESMLSWAREDSDGE